jgi:hypothetical protein
VARCFPKPDGEHRFGNNVARSSSRYVTTALPVPSAILLSRARRIDPALGIVSPFVRPPREILPGRTFRRLVTPPLHSSFRDPRRSSLAAAPSPFLSRDTHLAPCESTDASRREILMTSRSPRDYLWLRDRRHRSLNFDPVRFISSKCLSIEEHRSGECRNNRSTRYLGLLAPCG